MRLQLLYGLISLCLLSTSCKKEPEVTDVDTDSPSITLTGISDNDTLRNSHNVEIKATDNTGIKSIEVFADDSLLASATKSPLALTWNTVKLKDGNYTFKVIATDTVGNKKEQKIPVSVQNALFSFDTNGYDRLSKNTSYIITDNEGKILNSIKFTDLTAPKAGERTYIYPKVNFTGSHINVVRVQKISYYSIEYFLKVKRGHYTKTWNRFESNYSSPKIGQRKISVKNIPLTFGQSVIADISGSASSFSYLSNPNWINYTKDSKILVMYEKNSDFLYHLFDVNKSGTDVQELDVAQCTSQALSKTFSFPTGATDGNLTPWGGPHKDFDEIYHLGNKSVNGNPVKVYYPAELPNLSGNTYFNYQGATHYRTYYNELPTSIPPVNFTATVPKKNLTDFSANFSGDFQFYIARFTTSQVNVSVIGFKDQASFKLPDISAEVSIPGFNPAQLPLRDIQMTKYDLPVDVNMLFDWILGPVRQGSRSNYASKIQPIY
jgi:hypothetical protein